MADDSGDKKPRVFRTRKSEIISGASVGLILTLLGAQWKFRDDMERIVKERVDAAATQCRADITEERTERKEQDVKLDNDIRDIRQILINRRR